MTIEFAHMDDGPESGPPEVPSEECVQLRIALQTALEKIDAHSTDNHDRQWADRVRETFAL